MLLATTKRMAIANARDAKAKMQAATTRKARARWFWTWQAYEQQLEDLRRDTELEIEHARRVVQVEAAWRCTP